MNSEIHVGGRFPDLALPDHRDRLRKLSDYTQPTTWDHVMGWDDGYPLIIVFYRGFF